MNTTQEVALSLIDIPECFRQHTMESVDTLAQDIQRNGQLQEILVTPKEGGRYELVAGKRRTLALRHLNWQNVRVQVRENLSELQKALIMIAENDEREDVNPFDRALSYQRAIKAGATQRELAEKVGTSEQNVSGVLNLLQLAPEVTENFRRLKFSGAHLQELARLPDAQSQLKMADACDKQGWSSKVLRDKVSRALAGGAQKESDPSATQTGARPPSGVAGGSDPNQEPFQFVRKGKFYVLKSKMLGAIELIDALYMQDLKRALIDFVAKEQQGVHMDKAA